MKSLYCLKAYKVRREGGRCLKPPNLSVRTLLMAPYYSLQEFMLYLYIPITYKLFCNSCLGYMSILTIPQLELHRENNNVQALTFGSSRRWCSVKKGVLKHLCWSLFLKKNVVLQVCFSVKFTKLLKAPILKNIRQQLLLNLSVFFCSI